ncbi:hypothetical protein BAE44_0007613 [Dichanthelium oligosanthes]|uniref:DUF4220 domain-containing protein n=1 Tax=Dichanthelium oligosanthes TaxID=888268 RepID=A0A1E5W1T2_9POAL|nr:hypothetical protein BAE44_0007613 [Dichanthelium oligosanthes]
MTADAVAVFALGHLAVAASAPGHQLLLFWAPFVLLHLGGQDTITAFSMQDNELWRRHLLVLVTQAAVATYVVSRSSWPDRRLLAATVLMFLCGLFKYSERTWCLFSARPEGLRKHSFDSLRTYMMMAGEGRTILTSFKAENADEELRQRIDKILKASGRPRPPALAADTTLVSDALANDLNSIAGADVLPELLRGLKSNQDRFGAYHHVAALLSSCYDNLYTKGGLRGYWIEELKRSLKFIHIRQAKLGFLLSILVLLFPFLSMSATLVLFVFSDKYQLYSRVDVIVSYILLIGAIVLEVASLVMSILSHSGSSAAICVHLPGGRKQQWSQVLGQYNMTEAYNIEAHARTSSVPKWIHKLSSKLLGDKRVTHIGISENLKELVLDKLLEFGSHKEDWFFASSRGQLALKKREVISSAAMHMSIHRVDFPTSVLTWHIATDMCYFRLDNQADSDPTNKEMARNLSNYIMYLIFECRVMLTSNSKLVHKTTMEGMEKALGNKVLPSNEAIKMVYDHINTIEVEEAEDEAPLPQNSWSAPVHEANQGHQQANSASSSDQPVIQLQLLRNNIEALRSLVLPYACAVADELADIPGGRPWDLISAVWLEMLYYIAPRCGGDFHSEHLSTGGEFATHVMVLMHQLGPFLPPPGA